jgi:hypothetical protein
VQPNCVKLSIDVRKKDSSRFGHILQLKTQRPLKINFRIKILESLNKKTLSYVPNKLRKDLKSLSIRSIKNNLLATQFLASLNHAQ